MDWLDPLREALLRADGPVQFFFRDDDAGWDDARLFALLDVFEARGVPIDLAVIPQALNDPLAEALRTRRAHAPGQLGLHQHGFCHDNHEQEGRKCEFGPARTLFAQRDDIARGHARLERLLGWTDPIFTPPWNRCTQATAQALAELGFEALSRDAGAVPLRLAALREIPVCIDWCKAGDGIDARMQRIAQSTAVALGRRLPVGIMLHHAVMDEADLARLDVLLALLRQSPRVHCLLMREVAAIPSDFPEDLPSTAR